MSIVRERMTHRDHYLCPFQKSRFITTLTPIKVITPFFSTVSYVGGVIINDRLDYMQFGGLDRVGPG